MCISCSVFHRPPRKEADWSFCRLSLVRSLRLSCSRLDTPLEGSRTLMLCASGLPRDACRWLCFGIVRDCRLADESMPPDAFSAPVSRSHLSEKVACPSFSLRAFLCRVVSAFLSGCSADHSGAPPAEDPAPLAAAAAATAAAAALLGSSPPSSSSSSSSSKMVPYAGAALSAASNGLSSGAAPRASSIDGSIPPPPSSSLSRPAAAAAAAELSALSSSSSSLLSATCCAMAGIDSGAGATAASSSSSLSSYDPRPSMGYCGQSHART
mmetsp:Transcript_27811/g.91454  ORF Transcript_27811/g.91454 Transcript_27811/m.91454 type:complete len:268 (-) Transcript_27811:93-896(-)